MPQQARLSGVVGRVSRPSCVLASQPRFDALSTIVGRGRADGWELR
ncbi:hypothetical protein [Mycobacterium sp.]